MKQTASQKPAKLTTAEHVAKLYACLDNLHVRVTGAQVALTLHGDVRDKIEQLEATRVNYDELAGLVREIKDLIAQRVAYGVPLLASRPSTWIERLCGAGKRTEYILRLERVSYQ